MSLHQHAVDPLDQLKTITLGHQIYFNQMVCLLVYLCSTLEQPLI